MVSALQSLGGTPLTTAPTDTAVPAIAWSVWHRSAAIAGAAAAAAESLCG
jgi:hypothetical protein